MFVLEVIAHQVYLKLYCFDYKKLIFAAVDSPVRVEPEPV